MSSPDSSIAAARGTKAYAEYTGGGDSIEHALYLGWGEYTGRAATEEDGLHWSLARQRLPGTYLCTDRLDIAVVEVRVPGYDGKGAIRTALWAERDMHIEAECLR